MATFLSLASHVLSPKARIGRRWFWLGLTAAIAVIFLLEPFAESLGGRWGTILFYLPIYWFLFCLASQRCHDVGISAGWLVFLIVPILGVVWFIAVLGFRRGAVGENQYGADPKPAPQDYLVVQAVS